MLFWIVIGSQNVFKNLPIVSYLFVLNHTFFSVWVLFYHGYSCHSHQGKTGADLSEKELRKSSGHFVNKQQFQDLKVWKSWMKRTIQTANSIKTLQVRWKALNEIDTVSVSL